MKTMKITLALVALAGLSACQEVTDAAGNTVGLEASASYVPASVVVEADSDFDIASEDAASTLASLAPGADHQHPPVEGLPGGTRLVTLDAADVTVARIGFLQAPSKPEGAEDGPGERPAGPPPAGEDGQRPPRPESEPGDHPDRPEPGTRPDFDNLIEGPFALNLLTANTLSALEDVALVEDARYIAVMEPVSGDTPSQLTVSGVYSDDNTSFAFAFSLDITHPIVTMLKHNPETGEAAIRIPIARALSHANLPACVVETPDADNVYGLAATALEHDRENPEGCRLRGMLHHMSHPHHHRGPDAGPQGDFAESGNLPAPTVVCNGSDAWCAEVTEGQIRLHDVCVTAVERNEDEITVTIAEERDDCLNPPKPNPDL